MRQTKWKADSGEWIKRKYPYAVISEISTLNGFLQKIFFPLHLLRVFVNVKLRNKSADSRRRERSEQ